MHRRRLRGIVSLLVAIVFQPLLAIVPMTARAAACTAVPSGAVSWWLGDGTADDMFNANHATLQGGTTFPAAKVNQGFGFDSDDDRAVMPNSPGLNPTAAGFTVEFWMKGIHNQPQALFDVIDKSHGFGDFTGWTFQGENSNGQVAFITGDGAAFAGVSTGVDVLDGAFHHIAGTWDGASIRMYVDGVLTNTLARPPVANNVRNLNFGFAHGGGTPQRFFRGTLDEPAIYNRALSLAEIQSIVTADDAGKCRPPVPPCVAAPANLASWWPGDGNAQDIQGGYHAALQGGTTFRGAKVGQGFTFDSDDDRATTPHAAALNPAAPGFTVEFWMKGAHNQPQAIYDVVDKSHGFGDAAGWTFQGDSGNGHLAWLIGNGAAFSGINSLGDVLDGAYHHIVGTWDGAIMRLYIDGVLQGTDTLVVPVNNTRALNFGYSYGGGSPQRFFRGSLDEVSIYGRALSQAEIQGIHANDAGGKCHPPVPPTPACVVAPADMTAWWAGDGNAQDIQGGHHGTLQGGTTFQTANVGQGFAFDSDDDRVTVASHADLNPASPGFSVDFWMKGTKTSQPQTYYTVVEKSHALGGNTGWAFNGTSATGVIRFAVGDGAGFPEIQSTTDVLNDAWHHVTGTWDGSNIRLYIDGVQEGGMAALTAPVDSTGGVNMAFWHGNGTPQRFYRGRLDEVQVYKRALSQAEIQTIVSAGQGGVCKSPIPVITSVSHSPAAPTTAQPVTLTGNATDETGVTTMEIYLDGTGPADLKTTCNFASAQTTANCSVNVGALSAGLHLTTVKAYDATNGVGTGTESFTVTASDTTPPPAPTLLSPADGSATNDSTPTFDWSDVSDPSVPVTYDMQADGDAGFGSPEVSVSGLSVSTFTPGAALADGTYFWRARATDGVGNVGPYATAFSLTIDATAPDTAITSSPTDPTASPSANFTFTATESATFECSLDGAAYAPCTSPASYAGLADGSHAFAVRATDTAGNTDASPASFSWTVDTITPVVTITSGPSGLTSSTSAMFTWTVDDGSPTECSLDGAAYAPCTSPASYAGLADGSHIFDVRATDAVGHIGSDSRTWTIDATAPDTAITSSPSDPTASTSASFEFTATEASSTFECSLDAAAFVTCTSPAAYAGLSDGTHTFEVRATDPLGNTDASPASFSWAVDTEAPIVTITSGPTGTVASTSASFTWTVDDGSPAECSLDGAAYAPCTSPASYAGLADGAHDFSVRATDAVGHVGSDSRSWTVDATAPETAITSSPSDPTASTSASFEFTSTEAGSTFECSLDAAPFTSCVSPASYSGLADGAHAFQVRATDPASNVDASPASFSWTVDTVAPVVTITSGPSDPSASTSASFAWTVDDGSPAECSLDGAAYALCVSPASYAGLADGSHTFNVRATDAVGHVGSDSQTWTIDATAPDTAITSSPSDPTASTSASFEFTATEAGSTFECSLDAAAFAACTSPAAYTGLSDGTHTFEVRATDPLGNTDASPASFSWTVDTEAPVVTITSGPTGTVATTSASFTWTVDDGSPSECSLDGAAYAPCTSPASYTGFADGAHDFSVRATDAVGHVGSDSRSWTVDASAPNTTITSSPTNPTTSTSATFTFTSTEAGSTFACSLDGAVFTPCTSPKSYMGLAFGAHQFSVKATDAVGNVDATPATFTWTINAPTLTFTVQGGTSTGCVTNPDASQTCTFLGNNGRTYTVTFPAGTTPIPPATTIGIRIKDNNAHKPSIGVEAQLPVGTTKSITLPRGSGSTMCIRDVAGGDFSVGTCAPANRVTIPAPGTSATFAPGKTIAVNAANTVITLTGLLHTVLESGDDEDGDQIADAADHCFGVSGTAIHRGCPSSVKIEFQRHTVGQGSNPGSTKAPVIGAVVRAFKKNDACVSAIGSNPHDYSTVYTTCAPFSEGLTDASGVSVNGVVPDQYLMISRDPVTGVYAGVNSGNVSSGAQASKQLQVIVRANGTSVPAKTTTHVGSLLYVIEPEYVEWNETQELYPFIFDAPDGDWDVTVTVTPPEGFTSDHESLSTDVNNAYKALQFTLTDVGSCWKCGTDVDIVIKHKGKTITQHHNVRTPMTEKFAKAKGLSDKDIKKEGIVVTRNGKPVRK